MARELGTRGCRFGLVRRRTSSAMAIARSTSSLAELGEPGYSSNRLYRVSYNGILADDEELAVIGGKSKEIREWMADRYESDLALTDVVRLGVQALDATREKAEDDEALAADKLEIATLNETRGRRKFERIARDDVSDLLDDSPSDA